MRRKKPAARCAGGARHAAQDTQGYGQSRALRRTAVRGVRRLAEAAGTGAVQGARCFCAVCAALAARQERKGAGAEEQGKDTGTRAHNGFFAADAGHRRGRGARARARARVRVRTADFMRQARARARAHNGFFAAGAGTGIQRAFLQQARGHGRTAGPRGGHCSSLWAGVRIGTWRLFSLRQKNNAPSGAMKCTKKEGACSEPRIGLWFSRRLRGLFAAGPLTARNPDFGLSASPGQM